VRVYNKELAKAVLEWIEDGNTWSDLARLLGWVKPNGRPDPVRIKRALGISECHSYKNGERYSYYAKTLVEANAIKIVEAIGRAPHEFDL
jgi:hypothetical protein